MTPKIKTGNVSFALLASLVFVVISFGLISPVSAADLGENWVDYGSYGGWSDYGSYGGWSDYGSYGDEWTDYGSYGGSYYDEPSWVDYGSYGGTYYDDVSGTFYDDVSGTYYDDTYGTYYDYYTPSYSYGGGSFDWGCGSYCGGGYSTPRYTPPVITQPAYPSSNSNVNTNTITNTNVNNVTNIDNSIRDSFNNYNSNNTSLVVAQPQTPVVYTPPVQTHPAPYCTINHAQYGGYGSGAYLSWSSTNATSAYISNLGSVAISGSQTVYPGSGMTYTMTVYGYNGQSATCSTWVAGTTYVPPVVQQPYVSLTQIPYTGFDFGPFGNAMYWAALMSFAVAGAYLMVYYRGGALALATAMVPARKQQFAPIVAPKAPILIEKEAAAAAYVAPVVASLKKAAGTIDAMAIVDRKDGSMPKIVIQRS